MQNGEVSSWEEKGHEKTIRWKTKITLSISGQCTKKSLAYARLIYLKATPKTPEEIAQEALLRYERRGRG